MEHPLAQARMAFRTRGEEERFQFAKSAAFESERALSVGTTSDDVRRWRCSTRSMSDLGRLLLDGGVWWGRAVVLGLASCCSYNFPGVVEKSNLEMVVCFR
jgi:hypothetical protein